MRLCPFRFLLVSSAINAAPVTSVIAPASRRAAVAIDASAGFNDALALAKPNILTEARVAGVTNSSSNMLSHVEVDHGHVDPVRILGLIVCMPVALLFAAGQAAGARSKQDTLSPVTNAARGTDEAALWWLGLMMCVHAASFYVASSSSDGTAMANVHSWSGTEPAMLAMLVGFLHQNQSLLRYVAVLSGGALLIAGVGIAFATESPATAAAIQGTTVAGGMLVCLLAKSSLCERCTTVPRSAFAAAWGMLLAGVIVDDFIIGSLSEPMVWQFLHLFFPMLCMGFCLSRSAETGTDRWMGVAACVLLLTTVLVTDASRVTFFGSGRQGVLPPPVSTSLSVWFLAPVFAVLLGSLASQHDMMSKCMAGVTPTAFAIPVCPWIILPGAPLLAARLPAPGHVGLPGGSLGAAAAVLLLGLALDVAAGRLLLLGEAGAAPEEVNQPDEDLESSSGYIGPHPSMFTSAPPYDIEACIHELICIMAAQSGSRMAVVYPGRGQQSTYKELVDRMHAIASQLRAIGIVNHGRVGLLAERSIAMLAGLLGGMAAGAAVVPCEPSWPRRRQADCMIFSQVQAIVMDEASRPSSSEDFPELPIVLLRSDGALLGVHGRLPAVSAAEEPALTCSSPSFVVWTSGSSGKPKAIVYPHQSAVLHCIEYAKLLKLDANHVSIMQSPIVWSTMEWQVFSPLFTGGSIVLTKPGGERDPAYFGELVRDCGVTTFCATPPFLDKVLDDFAERGSGSIQQVCAIGSVLNMTCVRRFYEICPGATLTNGYGASETATTMWTATTAPTTEHAPCGWPQASTVVVLLDADDKLITEFGQRGQICFGGLTQKYWGGSPADNARFRVVEPFGELYFTGDNGLWGEHGLEVLGRMDRQVQVNGIRIEPAEIEAAATTCPGLRDAVCVAPAVGATAILVLFVAPATVNEDLIRQHIAEQKPSYMIPHTIIRRDRLPLMEGGKFDMQEMKAIADRLVASSSVEIVDSLGIVRSVSRESAQVLGAVECSFALGMISTITYHWMGCGEDRCDMIPAAGDLVQYVTRNVVCADFLLFAFLLGGALVESMASKRPSLGRKELLCLAVWWLMGWPLVRAVGHLTTWFTPCSTHRWYLAMYLAARVFLAAGSRIAQPAEQVVVLGALTVFALSELAPTRPLNISPSEFTYAIGLVEDCGGYFSTFDSKFVLCLFVYVLSFHFGESTWKNASKWFSQKSCALFGVSLFSVMLVLHPTMGVFGHTVHTFQAVAETVVGCMMAALCIGCFAAWQPAPLRWLGQNSLAAFVIHAVVPVKNVTWSPQNALLLVSGVSHNTMMVTVVQITVVVLYPVAAIILGAFVTRTLRCISGVVAECGTLLMKRTHA